MRPLGVVVWLSLMAVGAAGAPEEKKSEPPARPEVRTLEVNSGVYRFIVRLSPGVPEPGSVQTVQLEMARIPPVPDPVYGEAIPIKDADLVAQVTDAAGGLALRYIVHAFGDAGTYGFDFTPPTQGAFKVELQGLHEGRKLSPSFHVVAGLWPLPEELEAEGKPKEAPPAARRMPAVPASIRGPAAPAMPQGTPPTPVPPVAVQTSAPTFERVMAAIGDRFAELQVALLAGRQPDFGRAKAALTGLRAEVETGGSINPGSAEALREMAAALDVLGKAVEGAKPKPAIEAFGRVTSEHCTRCHLVSRFKILKSPAGFPAELP